MPFDAPPVPLVSHARRRPSKLQWFLAGVLVGLLFDILNRAAALVFGGP